MMITLLQAFVFLLFCIQKIYSDYGVMDFFSSMSNVLTLTGFSMDLIAANVADGRLQKQPLEDYAFSILVHNESPYDFDQPKMRVQNLQIIDAPLLIRSGETGLFLVAPSKIIDEDDPEWHSISYDVQIMLGWEYPAESGFPLICSYTNYNITSHTNRFSLASGTFDHRTPYKSSLRISSTAIRYLTGHWFLSGDYQLPYAKEVHVQILPPLTHWDLMQSLILSPEKSNRKISSNLQVERIINTDFEFTVAWKATRIFDNVFTLQTTSTPTKYLSATRSGNGVKLIDKISDVQNRTLLTYWRITNKTDSVQLQNLEHLRFLSHQCGVNNPLNLALNLTTASDYCSYFRLQPLEQFIPFIPESNFEYYLTNLKTETEDLVLAGTSELSTLAQKTLNLNQFAQRWMIKQVSCSSSPTLQGYVILNKMYSYVLAINTTTKKLVWRSLIPSAHSDCPTQLWNFTQSSTYAHQILRINNAALSNYYLATNETTWFLKEANVSQGLIPTVGILPVQQSSPSSIRSIFRFDKPKRMLSSKNVSEANFIKDHSWELTKVSVDGQVFYRFKSQYWTSSEYLGYTVINSTSDKASFLKNEITKTNWRLIADSRYGNFVYQIQNVYSGKFLSATDAGGDWMVLDLNLSSSAQLFRLVDESPEPVDDDQEEENHPNSPIMTDDYFVVKVYSPLTDSLIMTTSGSGALKMQETKGYPEEPLILKKVTNAASQQSGYLLINVLSHFSVQATTSAQAFSSNFKASDDPLALAQLWDIVQVATDKYTLESVAYPGRYLSWPSSATSYFPLGSLQTNNISANTFVIKIKQSFQDLARMDLPYLIECALLNGPILTYTTDGPKTANKVPANLTRQHILQISNPSYTKPSQDKDFFISEIYSAAGKSRLSSQKSSSKLKYQTDLNPDYTLQLWKFLPVKQFYGFYMQIQNVQSGAFLNCSKTTNEEWNSTAILTERTNYMRLYPLNTLIGIV